MEKYIHTVHYYETDRMQITHHSNYIRFMEEARVDFLEKIGLGYDRLEAMDIMSPVMSVSCQYKNPTTFADKVEIEVKIAELTGAKVKFQYDMRANGKLAAVGESLHCFVTAEGHLIRLKSEYPDIYAVLENLAKP